MDTPHEAHPAIEPSQPASRFARLIPVIEHTIFAVRWLLVLPYMALILTMVMYVAHLLHEVGAMAYNWWFNITEQNVLLLFGLEILDMVLICQLFVMTIQGGYYIFIRPLDEAGFVLPQWLRHGLGTSDQKIKFGMSIINIMMVQMLDMFIEMLHMKPEELTRIQQEVLPMRVELFVCAIIGTLSFCVFNLLMHPDMVRKMFNKDDSPHA